MSDWLELLLLAFASMFWPTLILIVVLALRVSQPVKILVWFLAGGLLTTITIGIAVVFTLQDASFMNGSKPTINPVLDLTIGLLALLGAFALLRRPAKSDPPPPQAVESPGDPSPRKQPLTERAVESGAPVAFVSGIVLNIIPGALPIIALKDIAQLNVSDGAKVATIVVFYVIMFACIEVPIVAFLFVPERTSVLVNEFNDWLGRNARRVSAYVLGGIGVYLTVRGIFQALS